MPLLFFRSDNCRKIWSLNRCYFLLITSNIHDCWQKSHAFQSFDGILAYQLLLVQYQLGVNCICIYIMDYVSNQLRISFKGSSFFFACLIEIIDVWLPHFKAAMTNHRQIKFKQIIKYCEVIISLGAFVSVFYLWLLKFNSFHSPVKFQYGRTCISYFIWKKSVSLLRDELSC